MLSANMMKDFDTVARLVQCGTAFFTALRTQDLQTLYSLIVSLLAPKTADVVTAAALDPSEDSDQEFDDAAGEFRPKAKSQDNLIADDLNLYFALSYTSNKIGEYLLVLEDSGSGGLSRSGDFTTFPHPTHVQTCCTVSFATGCCDLFRRSSSARKPRC